MPEELESKELSVADQLHDLRRLALTIQEEVTLCGAMIEDILITLGEVLPEEDDDGMSDS